MSALCVALVAGEASGDILGSGLMRALKARHPDIRFIGVGGPLMEAEGLSSYFPMERLAVMGLVEVLGRLPELLKRRKLLIQTLIEEKPDVFIGIDAPDFTLNIELKLRRAGIRTVHYVSPSVWAWRQKRVLKIREGCDLMLTLFPFEAKFYEEQGVPVRFVGHPLADTIPLEADRQAARQALGLPDGPLVALMPGSRGGEVGRLGALFLDTAQRLRELIPGVRFVSPCANAARRAQLEQMLVGRDLPLTLLDGRSHQQGVPVRFVGHPLADTIPLEADRQAARQALGLPDGPLVALMPGSRGGEVGRLGALFLDTAQRLRELIPGVRFVSPCANAARRAQLEQMLVGRDLPLTLLDGRSHQALAACDAVLIASGTATLEALLFKRPMVVAYRLAPLSYWILKRLVKSPYVSLPNLLAQRLLVPELLQDAATAEALAQTLAPLVGDGAQQTDGFDRIHRTLRLDASNQAADAVLALLEDR